MQGSCRLVINRLTSMCPAQPEKGTLTEPVKQKNR